MHRPVCLLATIFALCVFGRAADRGETFTNPLLDSGPDPWVTRDGNFYYYMNTTGVNLTLWKTRDVTDLRNAERKVVWTPPEQGPYSHEIWAPEIHKIGRRWYIYFAADDGNNRNHRLWVLQSSGRDPMKSTWKLKGKVADPSDRWAIDGSVFKHRRRLYLIWSGWEGDSNGTQNIYIARLRRPWKVKGNRVRISTPEFSWEMIGDFAKPDSDGLRHVNVNEGPEILKRNGKIFLVYSASGCWTDSYALGMLTAGAKSNLLNPASWQKSSSPVFTGNPEAHAYAPGHNSFFRSPDGKQSWILYHANPNPQQGCSKARSPRAQPFVWNPDNTPDFGVPVPTGKALPKPSTGQTLELP
jgi:GH43 family beta-xylosidase